MNRYVLLFISLNLCGAEKDLPKPIIRPREVIIYPPTTAAEFLERHRILHDALRGSTITRIMVKDQKPQLPTE